jgi:hypothetical protein
MGLRTLLGAVLPLRFTAAVLLRRGVEHIRSEQRPLPDVFYDEFVGEVIRMHEFMGKKGIALKSAVVSDLERDIIVIAALLDGERSPVFPDDGMHMRLLRKHGLI